MFNSTGPVAPVSVIALNSTSTLAWMRFVPLVPVSSMPVTLSLTSTVPAVAIRSTFVPS